MCCLLFGCAAAESPLEVGTNTSWLTECDETGECGGVGSCRCRVCTTSCTSDAECGPGVCGSELATNGQCGAVAETRLCLPKPKADADANAAATCTVLPVAADADLQLSEPSCATPNALLCESFDAPLPDAYSTWYRDESGVASLQDCEVAHGAGALRLLSSEFGYAQTRMRLASPVTEGPLHMRVYGYFGADLRIPDYIGLFELWSNEEGPGNKIGLDAIGNDQLEVNLSPFSSVLLSPEGVLLRDRWLCIELGLELSTEGGSVTVTIDGTPIIDAANVVTSPGEAFSVAVIESSPATNATGVHLVFDELVVATEPIGCL